MKNAGKFTFSFLLLTILYFHSINAQMTPHPSDFYEYRQSLAKWDADRLERLKSPEGWINLAGLFWLKEGENSIGSAEGQDIVFHRGPSHAGILKLEQSHVTFTKVPGADVLADGKPFEGYLTVFNDGSPATLITFDSLGFVIIKRGNRIGIRLRDYQHPNLQLLQKIDRFEPKEDWIVLAKNVIPKEAITMLIPDVLGDVHKETVPGILEFEAGGETHRLYPTDSGGKLFIVFADETNGLETYGGGRFLYTDGPDENGHVVLDFNKAYNPPCAFSPYATCPVPPAENRLPISILAGEKSIKTN